MKSIIEFKNISKEYNLGKVGYGTLYRDIQSLYAKILKKPDPNSIIGSGKILKNKVLALNKINLKINEGEVIGIIGANGAGKSTLLKVLSRITSPSIGEIIFYGRIASLLEVGTGFHPELTGRENIYLNAAIYGMTKIETSKKINEIIEFSGVGKYIDTPVKRYSSGMHVRLGFAVAAYLEPDILVVDEVLAVGDAEFQKKAIGKIKDISNHSKRTILFVSHNMVSIANLCTRAILLENGKIIADGKPNIVISQYLENKNNKNVKKIIFDNIQKNKKKSNFSKRILHSFSILNEKGKKNNYFNLNDEIIFKISVFKKFNNMHKTNMQIEIKDIYERTIVILNNRMMKDYRLEQNSNNDFLCIWNNCNLVPGTYTISITIKKIDDNTLSESYKNFISFFVFDKSSNIYHKDTLIYPEGRWQNA